MPKMLTGVHDSHNCLNRFPPHFHRRPRAAAITALEERRPATRALAAHYDALLAPFAVGDDGQAEPGLGEMRPAVRRRLNAAAARRGWRLAFVGMEGEGVVFRVAK